MPCPRQHWVFYFFKFYPLETNFSHRRLSSEMSGLGSPRSQAEQGSWREGRGAEGKEGGKIGTLVLCWTKYNPVQTFGSSCCFFLLGQMKSVCTSLSMLLPDRHPSVPRTYECVTLCRRRDLSHVGKLRTPRWRDGPG